MSFHLRWLLLSLLVILVDQASKYWAEHILGSNIIVVFSWFDLQLAHNSGAAFGILANAGGWQKFFFLGVAIIATSALIWMISQLKNHERHLAIAYSLVIAGAVGNAIDRLIYGYVVDFIHWFVLDCNVFGMRDCHWPNFNIADAAIFIGVALMLSEIIGKPFLNKNHENTAG